MADNNMAGVRVTVLGAGLSGVAIARMAKRFGAEVFVSDAAELSPDTVLALESAGIAYEQRGHTEKLFDCDKVVVGSGFPQNAPVLEKLAKRGVIPEGELDFVTPFLNGPIIGVTGSNGKTTTTSLLGHLIKAAGRNCAVAGNIGNPAADFAGLEYEYIVLELSSFQLHWAKNLKLHAAVVTNIAPDHIDWHGSFEKYAQAKTASVGFVEPGGCAVVQKNDMKMFKNFCAEMRYLTRDSSREYKDIFLSEEESLVSMEGKELFRFGDTRLLGVHNMENAAMAMGIVAALGLDVNAARASLSSYVPPAHRCSLVLEKNGVRYVDDSKGTNIAASVMAMSSISGPHIVIMGGRGKGEDFSGLAAPLKKYAKYVFLIGEAASEIALALSKSGFYDFTVVKDMENAVKNAILKASDGDSVLLSPACTSWDAYKNYKERGDHFASLVLKYAGGIS